MILVNFWINWLKWAFTSHFSVQITLKPIQYYVYIIEFGINNLVSHKHTQFVILWLIMSIEEIKHKERKSTCRLYKYYPIFSLCTPSPTLVEALMQRGCLLLEERALWTTKMLRQIGHSARHFWRKVMPPPPFSPASVCMCHVPPQQDKNIPESSTLYIEPFIFFHQIQQIFNFLFNYVSLGTNNAEFYAKAKS